MLKDQIKNFFIKNKKIIYYTLFFLAVLFFSSDIVFATTSASPASNELETKLIEGIQLLFRFIAAVLGLLTAFISIFLHPGWINGSLFGFDVYLKEIWVLISNVVYFIFAFILIWIAFMNIIGKGDKWELKQALPKFIVGVLIVPFSWFFVQFVLSISSILTVSVLSYPFETLSHATSTSSESQNEKDICNDFLVVLGSTGSTTPTPGTTGAALEKITDNLYCKKKVSLKEALEGNGDSIYSIISIYTYGVMSLDEISKLTKEKLTVEGGIRGILDLLFQTAFDALFIVVYFILMIALFLALFTRGVWLWIYAMFSPLFGLFYFFDKKEGGGDDALLKFNLKEFIGLAMVPVYVSAALSFGLLFLYITSKGLSTTQPGPASRNNGNPIVTSTSDTSTLAFGNFKFTLQGSISDSASSSFLSTFGVGSALGKLILEVFGLVILCIAVMAALKSSTITKEVTEPIYQFGKSVGELAMKAPTYAPILPGGLSAQGLHTVGGQMKDHYERMPNDKARFWMKENGLFQNEDSDKNYKADQLASKWRNGKKDNETLKEIIDHIRSLKDFTEFKNNNHFINLAKEVGMNEAEILKDENGLMSQINGILKGKPLLSITGPVFTGTTSSSSTPALPRTIKVEIDSSGDRKIQISTHDGRVDNDPGKISVGLDGKVNDINELVSILQKKGYEQKYIESDFDNIILDPMGIKNITIQSEIIKELKKIKPSFFKDS